jgi:SAM-dependent methyltransferase
MKDEMGEWVYRFIFPDGEITNGPRSKGEKNLLKTKVIQSLNLKNKRVFDLGSADGLFSFYMAQEGAMVVGLEKDYKRVIRANYAKQKLNLENVQFLDFDLRDDDSLKKLGRFDVGFCFAVIHRVPDPFNLIAALSTMCETIVFEWKSPQGLLTNKASFAIHEVSSEFDFSNISSYPNLDDGGEKSGTRGTEKPYWTMSIGAVQEILKSFGFVHFQGVQIGRRQPLKILFAWVVFILQSLSPGDNPISYRRSQRVLLIASKDHKFPKLDLKGGIHRADWDGTES